MKQTARYIMKNVNKIMKCYNRILSRSPKNVLEFFALEWFAKPSNLLKSLIACDRNRLGKTPPNYTETSTDFRRK